MLPVIFSFGPFTLRTMSIFGVLAFLAGAFVFWRKAREEHYHEDQIFDAFLLSILVGVVTGRIGFLLVHYREFGWSVLKWLDLVSFPGSLIFVFLLGAAIHLYRYAKKKGWDAFEVLDFGVLAISTSLVFLQVGQFFEGTNFGLATNLPWGVVFPGVFETHHPTQLYSALAYLILFGYLTWVEYHYRTFQWYRRKKKTAQTGFLTSVFLMAVALINGLLLLVKPAQLAFQGINIDAILYVLLFITGFLLLYVRSGRSLAFWRRDKSLLGKFKVGEK